MTEPTRYHPELIAEIFGGHYFVTFYPDGTCAVTTWTGGEWIQLRRR